MKTNKISRQEQGFNFFVETLMKLILADKDIPNKRDAIAFFQDLFSHKATRSNMIQAFSNFMWDFDDKVQQDVANELQTILDMIPKIADPENENTKKIAGALKNMIDEAVESVNYDTPEELKSEFTDEDLNEVGGIDPNENKSLL